MRFGGTAALTPPLRASDPSESLSSSRVETQDCENACAVMRSEAAEPVLRDAQRRWAARPLVERLGVVRAARQWMAAHPLAFAAAVSPDLARSQADTLVSELLPLLDALRFLERRARHLLAPRVLGRSGRPLWLGGVQAEVERAPLGHVLVIGPSNFPLFLPGVQAIQALTAGNAVTWKPGAGGAPVALLAARALREGGLPRGVLRITDESVRAAEEALQASPDKVVFTGSVPIGKAVLHQLADAVTPAVVELSGADAVIVLPSADLSAAAKAVAFGLRLNGGAVCMSPRRLLVTPETLRSLRPLLQAELAEVPPVRLKPETAGLLRELAGDALRHGARLGGEVNPDAQRPLLIEDAKTGMAIAGSDLFAPVLSVIEVPSVLHIADAVNDCRFALTAAIFGQEREARALGAQLRVGTVLINDLIAPTADPRVPFSGRGQSGYGATRGADGLLEMTTAKTVLVRRKGVTRHYGPAGAAELPLFQGVIGALHGGSLRERWKGLRKIAAAGRARHNVPD